MEKIQDIVPFKLFTTCRVIWTSVFIFLLLAGWCGWVLFFKFPSELVPPSGAKIVVNKRLTPFYSDCGFGSYPIRYVRIESETVGLEDMLKWYTNRFAKYKVDLFVEPRIERAPYRDDLGDWSASVVLRLDTQLRWTFSFTLRSFIGNGATGSARVYSVKGKTIVEFLLSHESNI
jgi:hypothetical protein